MLYIPSFRWSHVYKLTFNAHVLALARIHSFEILQHAELTSGPSNQAIQQSYMSPSEAPWPENDKLQMNGRETHHVEPDKEKKTVEPNEQSTATSSTVNDLDNTEFPREDGSDTKEGAVHELQEPVKRSSGIEFFLIILALVLAIFLFSWDQVSSTAPSISQTSFSRIFRTSAS